jgi:O-antigen/teichoic acid export membrane protein
VNGSTAGTTGVPAHATTWIAVGSALNGVAAFLFQVVGTRALGPVGYAPIGVLWTLQYLWIAVAVTALEAYVARLVIVNGPGNDQLRRFLRILNRWLFGAAATVTAIAWLLRAELFAGLGDLAVVLGLLILSYGWYGVVRGRATGLGRFRAYGLATIGESALRLVAAIALLAVAATTRSLAWAFPVGPLLVAGLAWVRRHPTARLGPDLAVADEVVLGPRGVGRRFLVSTSTANACVQFLLAGGPIVLVPLGASAAAISVFFTTITAARVPMTFALNGGLSRLLPPLTHMAQADDAAGLRRAAVRMLGAIVGGAVLAAAGGAAIGPEVVELVFGSDFRPERTFVTIVAVSTVLGVGGLLLDQLYIATGREGKLPAVWLGSVALAAVLVLVLPGTPTMRVATAFLLALATALAALGLPLLFLRSASTAR